MPTKRINQLIGDLPFERKLLAVGSILMVISLFMPWYQDVDQFKTGDVFFGLSGPLYLVGFSVLALMAVNIALMISDAFGKKMPFLNIKPSSFFLASGIVCFYLLLIANSVYFHSKFGVNIAIKQSDFGMFFAFIAASLVTIGGYLASRDRATLLKEFEEQIQQPMVNMPQQDIRKPKENLRSMPQTNLAPQKLMQTQLAQPEEPPKPAAQSFRTDL
jgi:hypothetical protein